MTAYSIRIKSFGSDTLTDLGTFEAEDAPKACDQAAAEHGLDPFMTGMMVITCPPVIHPTYTLSADGEDHVVQSIYREGDYDLIVRIAGGRDFRVGSAETPTFEEAVRAAKAECSRIGSYFIIVERQTHAAHMADIDRINGAHADLYPEEAINPWYLVKGER